MTIKELEYDFSVCKIKDAKDINFDREYVFVAKTDEELSLVCEKDCIPKNCIAITNGFKAFKILGELDFSLVGILSKISSILAESGISIFAVSTYNTDYILVNEKKATLAKEVLIKNGYEVI